MKDIYSVLKLWGERYVYADTQQAELDLKQNREDMIGAFTAILEMAKAAAEKE